MPGSVSATELLWTLLPMTNTFTLLRRRRRAASRRRSRGHSCSSRRPLRRVDLRHVAPRRDEPLRLSRRRRRQLHALQRVGQPVRGGLGGRRRRRERRVHRRLPAFGRVRTPLSLTKPSNRATVRGSCRARPMAAQRLRIRSKCTSRRTELLKSSRSTFRRAAESSGLAEVAGLDLHVPM